MLVSMLISLRVSMLVSALVYSLVSLQVSQTLVSLLVPMFVCMLVYRLVSMQVSMLGSTLVSDKCRIRHQFKKIIHSNCILQYIKKYSRTKLSLTNLNLIYHQYFKQHLKSLRPLKRFNAITKAIAEPLYQQVNG